MSSSVRAKKASIFDVDSVKFHKITTLREDDDLSPTFPPDGFGLLWPDQSIITNTVAATIACSCHHLHCVIIATALVLVFEFILPVVPRFAPTASPLSIMVAVSLTHKTVIS
jgi:hypothetical protein